MAQKQYKTQGTVSSKITVLENSYLTVMFIFTGLSTNETLSRGIDMARSPITNEQEHAAALDRIELILEAEPGTPEGDNFDELVQLIEEYEDVHYPMP